MGISPAVAGIGQMMGLVVGSCEPTSELLSDQLEGTLHGVRRWRVSAHLARCDRCRAVLSSLTRAVEQLGLLRQADLVPPASASVADRVVEQIRREPS